MAHMGGLGVALVRVVLMEYESCFFVGGEYLFARATTAHFRASPQASTSFGTHGKSWLPNEGRLSVFEQLALVAL